MMLASRTRNRSKRLHTRTRTLSRALRSDPESSRPEREKGVAPLFQLAKGLFPVFYRRDSRTCFSEGWTRTPTKIETLDFSSRRKWRAWLAKNHRIGKEIWLVYDKIFFQTRAISYRDFISYAVEEAICYGWIDSRVKRIGQTKLGVRFTPRRSRKNWSKYNRARALKMLHKGKMTKAGIDALPPEWTNKSVDTATNGERQRIHYFHVEKWNGRIRSTEAERVYWESEASNLGIIPDRRAVQKILRVQYHRK